MNTDDCNNNSNNDDNNNNNNSIEIPSSDILHLLQSHLVECGLHTTSSTLRSESGGNIGLPGLFPSTKGTLLQLATNGQWGDVLQLLDTVDVQRVRRGYLEDMEEESHGSSSGGGGENDNSIIITPLEKTVALVHEMTILELADVNEIDLAYATLRMCSEMLDRTLSVHDDDNNDDGDGDGDGENNGVDGEQEDGKRHQQQSHHEIGMISTKSGDIERRITALSSMRRSTSSTNNSNNNASSSLIIPTNYYGTNNNNNNNSISKQKKRDQITKLLKKHVPEVPMKRLTTLLSQSIKWQCHTGTFPTVQRMFQHDDDEDDEDNKKDGGEGEVGNEEEDDKKKKKKKKKKRKNKHYKEQKFDLVLGNVDVLATAAGIEGSRKKRSKKDTAGGSSSSSSSERIPSRVYQSIRLGKKTYIESCCFLPDGKGLITGSSDGFIEVWGEPMKKSGSNVGGSSMLLPPTDINYEKLRTSDMPYQAKDDIMMQPNNSSVLSMSISNDGTMLGSTSSDGTVCVWKISDGTLLRKIEVAHGTGNAVTCITFSPDGSRVLTGGHDSTCREFGLLASRMLKEFRGHNSYVNCCSYVMLPHSVAVGISGDDDNNNSSSSSSSKLPGNSLLVVVTASADGSVIVWNGRSAEPLREINPPIPTSANAVIHDKDSVVGSKSIHTVIHLHRPADRMIVVPRSDRAFLMSYSGSIVRTYTRDDVQASEYLAANVSPSNQYLYIAASDGKCVVFDIELGTVEKIIHDFADECSISGKGRSENEKTCEISGIVCHPHGGYIGGYSNNKGQKRGLITLWK